MSSIVIVTTPADSYDLTVLQTVKDEFGITDTSQDALIETWIRQASQAIATECNRVFAEETVTETFVRSRYARDIVLSRTPVTSISSVTGDGTALTTADYDYDVQSGVMYRYSSGDVLRMWDERRVVVTYTGGYALLGDLPYDLERACIQMVKHFRANGMRDDPYIKAEEIPGVLRQEFWVGQIGQVGQLPPDVMMMVQKYKHMVIA